MCFDHFNVQKITPENVVAHFTDLLRTFNLPTPYSATQLHEVGKCLLDIKFNLKNRVLKITCLEPWKATLNHKYFSTPWRTASTIAGIFLLVFTLIQTLCSVIQ
ncbi:hypothetical protein CFP56_004969, partial [Quercus suber]